MLDIEKKYEETTLEELLEKREMLDKVIEQKQLETTDFSVWVSKDGRETPINELEKHHLNNIVESLKSKEHKTLVDMKWFDVLGNLVDMPVENNQSKERVTKELGEEDIDLANKIHHARELQEQIGKLQDELDAIKTGIKEDMKKGNLNSAKTVDEMATLSIRNTANWDKDGLMKFVETLPNGEKYIVKSVDVKALEKALGEKLGLFKTVSTTESLTIKSLQK